MPKIHVLTFRDEFRMEPRQLMAFEDESEAASTRDRLQQRFHELWNSRETLEIVNKGWREFLAKKRIPEDRWFDIDTERHSNIAFEVRELELIESTKH